MRHLAALISLVFFAVSVFAIQTNWEKSASAQTQSIQPEDVTVSVGIGTPILQLYGYTSPFADVGLLAYPGVTTRTFSSETGYFEFNGVFIVPQTREICLWAIDREKRTTNPVCIPSPGINFTQGKIGPVILPPSVSVESGSFLANQTVAATGESLPDRTIRVSFFRGNPTLLTKLTTVIPQALAVALPTYTIQTDKNGYYSFNLPSGTANTFRIFTQTNFNNSPSPKSNTLTFRVLTLFEWIILQLLLFLKFLLDLLGKLPLLETIIILQLIILFSLIYWQKRREKHLMVVQRSLSKINNYPQVISNFPA